MAVEIVVEDGTCPAGANSYVSYEDADAYIGGRALWGQAVDTEARKALLIRASDWLNSLPWKGAKTDWQRRMAWPRRGVPVPGSEYAGGPVPIASPSPSEGELIPENAVPSAVAFACMEMAVLMAGGADPFATIEHGGKLASESHSVSEGSVDVIGGDSHSDSYTYRSDAPAESYFPGVFAPIRDLLNYVPGQPSSGWKIVDLAKG